MSIRGVRGRSLDLGNEILIEEDLANMRDVAAAVGTVCIGGAVEVSQDVDVG